MQFGMEYHWYQEIEKHIRVLMRLHELQENQLLTQGCLEMVKKLVLESEPNSN